MVLIGVILVLLAAAAGVVLIAGTAQLTDSVQIDVLGGTLSIPPLTLLITGMVVISVFWLGWVLLRSGLRRSKRRRVEAKEAAAAAEAKRAEEHKHMQDEFAAREQALSEERRRREKAESLVAEQRAATPTTTTDGTPGSPDTTRVPESTTAHSHESTDPGPREGDRQV
jgi:type VI protein secretion system component VasK